MNRVEPADGEIEVLEHLAAAWNAFLELEVQHPDDVAEFRQLIHTAQNHVLGRIGLRCMREYVTQEQAKKARQVQSQAVAAS